MKKIQFLFVYLLVACGLFAQEVPQPIIPPSSGGGASTPSTPQPITPAAVPAVEGSAAQNQLDVHVARLDNPHLVTAAQVGAATTQALTDLQTLLQGQISAVSSAGDVTALTAQVTAIETLLTSDDPTLDTTQKRVDAIVQVMADVAALAVTDATLQTSITAVDTELTALQASVAADVAALQASLATHEARVDNPHAVTAAQVGAATPADLTALDTALQAQIAAGGGASTIADVTGLQAELDDKSLAVDLTAEVTDRTAGDAALQTNIDLKADVTALTAEVTDRTAGDAGLQSEVDQIRLVHAVNVIDMGAVPDDGIDDTLAFQAAIDTRRDVYIPNGVYDLSVTLSMATRGQSVVGESMTKTVLSWSADVDGISCDENTDGAGNLPGSSATFNNFNQLRNLCLIAPDGSTSRGWYNAPLTVGWNGEGTQFDNLFFINWGVGISFENGARINSRFIFFRDCEVGLRLDTAATSSNNCHTFMGINCSRCDIGVDLIGLTNGLIDLQDFNECRIGVRADGSVFSIRGGQLETWVDSMFDFTDSSVSIQGCRFLGSTTVVPIVLRNTCRLHVDHCDVSQAGNQNPIAKMIGGDSIVYGATSNLNRINNFGGDVASHYELQDGTRIMLSTMPFLVSRRITADDTTRGAIHLAKFTSNEQGVDDLRVYVKDTHGANFVATALKQNNFAVESTATNFTNHGYEDVILMSSTAVRNVNLRATNNAQIRANASNMRSTTIIDGAGNAATNNITLRPNGADTINGQATYVIDEDYGSVTLITAGDGKWFVKK